MIELLYLGFIVGISHAFEADHIAAVSALVSGKTKWKQSLRHGALWGLGHSLTLLTLGGTVIFTQSAIGPRLANGLEFTVGLMLIVLGGHVLYRLRRDRIHFHRHTHDEGAVHIHLHSHAGETGPHKLNAHAHTHPERAGLRSLLVGMMHGLAGSAALVLVAASALTSPGMGLAYVAIFGIGSIIGMALLSAAIAFPLRWSDRFLTRANSALRVVIGCLTIGIGLLTVYHSASALLA